MDTLIAAKDLASVLGISSSTVTYYTNLGLFEIEEVKGKKNLYKKEKNTLRYEKTKELRKNGYPLSLVKGKLDE